MPDSSEWPRGAGLPTAFIDIGKNALGLAGVDRTNDGFVPIHSIAFDGVLN
jgi:hypothetical protein